MAQTPGALSALVDRIAKTTKIIEAHLQANNQPQPSFDADAPKSFPADDSHPDVLRAREELIDCTQELQDLVTGPLDTIKSRIIVDHTFTATLQAIYRFKIAHSVPLPQGSTISLPHLATLTNLPLHNLTRLIRLSTVHRVFTEPQKGHVAHSALSRLIAEDSGVNALVGHMTDAAFPASARMCDFLEEFPGSEEPGESPFAVAFGGRTLFTGGPEFMGRFVEAMGAWSSGDGAMGVVRGYDWAKVGHGTVVDVGGAAGHISLAVASAFPDLSFVVQDLPSTEPQAAALIAAHPDEAVRSRVSWLAHDFFAPQPERCRGAAVYLLRYICHDWSDLYASRILAAVAAAMGPQSRLLVADAVLPPWGAGLPRAQEAILRAFDVSMLCQLNARERAIEDWEALLKMADGRLTIVEVRPPVKAGEVSIIEVKLEE